VVTEPTDNGPDDVHTTQHGNVDTIDGRSRGAAEQ
jgi:hypothetical protein